MTDEVLPGRVARAILQHLRKGTVPAEGLERLTVGREGWLRSLDQNLDDVAEGERIVRIVLGRYGDGKTHLLAVARAMAFRKSFAVATVTISRDVRLDRWDQLYRAIVTTLESGKRPEAGGLAALLDPQNPDPQITESFVERARRIRELPTINGSFAAAVFAYTTRQVPGWDAAEDILTVRSWLEGGPVPAEIRKRFGLQEKIDKTNGLPMLRSLVLTLRHFGYAGILLLIDETESTLSQTRRIRADAYDNLRFLLDSAELPRHLMVLCAATPEMFSDDEKGFQSYPALWQRVSGFGHAGPVSFDAPVVDLTRTPLSASDYQRVGEAIRTIYAAAHNLADGQGLDPGFIRAAAQQAESATGLAVSATRVFVKLISTEMDRARDDPAFKADVRRLPSLFRDIDAELDAGRSSEEWN